MSTSRARKAVPKLRRSSNGMLMTPEELHAAEIDDDLYIYELIRGVLIVSPRPSESERDPNDGLGHLLRSYQAEHSQASPLDKTLSEQTMTLVANSSRPSETGVFSRQDALSCPDSGLSAADGNSPPVSTSCRFQARRFASLRSENRRA